MPGKRRAFVLSVHAIDDSKEQLQVLIGEAVQLFGDLTGQDRISGFCSKELLRCNAEIVANHQKFAHGWQCSAGGNTLNVAFAVTEIEAHLVFGYAFFHPKLGEPAANIVFCHDKCTAFPTYCIIFSARMLPEIS